MQPKLYKIQNTIQQQAKSETCLYAVDKQQQSRRSVTSLSQYVVSATYRSRMLAYHSCQVNDSLSFQKYCTRSVYNVHLFSKVVIHHRKERGMERQISKLG